MSDQLRKFYVSSGDAKLVVLADVAGVAACDLIQRLIRDSFKVEFGPTIFVSEQGFRNDDNADDDTYRFDTYLIFLCSGIIGSMTSREQFDHFFFTSGGQSNGIDDDDEERQNGFA
jgi:hypothetical protein